MLRRRFPATVLAVLAAVLLAAGCGSESNDDSSDEFKGDEQQVAKAIEELEEQAIKPGGKGAKEICTKLITDQLARRIAAQKPNENCDERLETSLKDIGLSGGRASLKVESVTVTGDKAVAKVTAENRDDDETSEYTLVRTGKTWQISGF